MDILKIDNLSKTISTDTEKVEILRQVSFKLSTGSFTTLIGPSGCGKSTLLRIIADLIKADLGSLEWTNPKPKISFVFQNFALFPHLTVLENIEFGLKMQGMNPKKRFPKVRDLIYEMELNGFEDQHPNQLSGGMKQRVGIARALATEPDLLLCDEPFSSLDEFTADNLRKLLLKIYHSRKMTVLMVTHLITEALEMADNILVMSNRPGKIQKTIDNNLPRPRKKRSEHFFKLEDQIRELIQI